MTHSPNDLLLQLSVLANDHERATAPRCRFLPVIGEHHGVPLGVQLDPQVGVQERAQRAQEAADIPQQLVRRHQHHDDEGALGQLLGFVAGAVQPVPAALLAVAALVTAPVSVVICTVLVIPGAGTGLRAARCSGTLCTAHLQPRGPGLAPISIITLTIKIEEEIPPQDNAF